MAEVVSPPSFRVVQAVRQGPAVAPDSRSLRHLDFGDHAPADPGGHRRVLFQAVPRPVSQHFGVAQADEQEVLRVWEGLGYYRRARQLHLAAKKIVEEHGGVFPREGESVRTLPGIGRYTAGAILSIAFDARAPVLEANTLRLHARLLGYQGDPASAEGNRLLWSMAEAVLAKRGSGQLNQALMELGSMVCLPRRGAMSARWQPSAVLGR